MLWRHNDFKPIARNQATKSLTKMNLLTKNEIETSEVKFCKLNIKCFLKKY